MTTFLAYLFRLFVIMMGFALSTIAASMFFVLVVIVPHDTYIAEPLWDRVTTGLFIAIFVASFAGMIICIPFIVLAIISEVRGANGLLFHCITGAVLGSSATGFWQGGNAIEGAGQFVLVGTAAGIVGAAVYWLVAGRNAGKLFQKILASRAS